MQDRFLSLLGLATKAGKAVSGEFAVEQAIKDGKARLVILAGDASENTVKHFTDMCNYRSIPLVRYGTRESIGKCMGKQFRANAALTDEGFSSKLQAILQEV